jgi:hypothetical protein
MLGQLADRGRLAGAVDAGNHDHEQDGRGGGFGRGIGLASRRPSSRLADFFRKLNMGKWVVSSLADRRAASR